MRRIARVSAIVLVAAVAAAAFACGDDDASDDGPNRFEGAAASAVASYFAQEVDGGLIPEGTDVLRIGIPESRMFLLAIDDAQRDAGTEVRYCMEYQYATADGVRRFTRVYTATLADGVWTVALVAPDGTCEGLA